MMLIDPFRFRGSGPVSCEFQTFIDPGSGGMVHTIADQPTGESKAGRYIFGAAHWVSDNTPGSVTLNSVVIGGVSAAIHAQKSTATPSFSVDESGVALFSSQIDNGETADFGLTFNSDVALRGLAIWNVTNLISGVPIDFAATEGPDNPLATSCSVVASGVVLLAGICARGGDQVATGVTQEYGLPYLAVGGSYLPTADESRAFSTQFGPPVTAGAPFAANVVASFR